MSRVSLISLLCAGALISACVSAPDRTTPASVSELMARYSPYAAAVAAGDLATAKQYLPAAKLAVIESMSDSAAHAKLSVLSPLSDLRFKKEWFEGEEAILIVTANVEGNEATGRIKLLRENDQWQVLGEMWNLGEGSEFLEWRDPPRTPAQKAAIRKLEERGFPRPSEDFMVMSASEGNLELLKLFLEAGFPVDSRQRTSTALSSAVRSERQDVALYLIEQGADVNAVDDINCTALIFAADKCGMTAVVEALLAKGARLDIKSAGGLTALEFAEMSGCTRNAELLRAAAR